MATIDFGGITEEVITSEEFSLAKAKEILKDETIAILGYGVQGPAQAMNLRDNGFNPIIGQLEGDAYWEKAVSDGFVPGKTLFPIKEAAQRGTIIKELLSDAGQVATWPATSWPVLGMPPPGAIDDKPPTAAPGRGRQASEMFGLVIRLVILFAAIFGIFFGVTRALRSAQ